MIQTDYITKEEFDVEKITKVLKKEEDQEGFIKAEAAGVQPPAINGFYNPYIMNPMPMQLPLVPNVGGMTPIAPMNPMVQQQIGLRMLYNNMVAVNNLKIQMMNQMYSKAREQLCTAVDTNPAKKIKKTPYEKQKEKKMEKQIEMVKEKEKAKEIDPATVVINYKRPFKILRQKTAKPFKPFQKPVRNDSSLFSPAKTDDTNEPKQPVRLKLKSIRVSACKNYIGLLCAGFARTVLTGGSDSAVINFIKSLFKTKKEQYDTLKEHQEDELVESLKRYIYNNMCGKKIKKSNRERDFKIRNTEELDALLVPKSDDKETTALRKEVLRDLVTFFFESECYENWLKRGMMSDTNRLFFVKNKDELHKKFLNPCTYKPHFTHNMTEPSKCIFD